jgi:hypothetical protein
MGECSKVYSLVKYLVRAMLKKFLVGLWFIAIVSQNGFSSRPLLRSPSAGVLSVSALQPLFLLYAVQNLSLLQNRPLFRIFKNQEAVQTFFEETPSAFIFSARPGRRPTEDSDVHLDSMVALLAQNRVRYTVIIGCFQGEMEMSILCEQVAPLMVIELLRIYKQECFLAIRCGIAKVCRIGAAGQIIEGDVFTNFRLTGPDDDESDEPAQSFSLIPLGGLFFNSANAAFWLRYSVEQLMGTRKVCKLVFYQDPEAFALLQRAVDGDEESKVLRKKVDGLQEGLDELRKASEGSEESDQPEDFEEPQGEPEEPPRPPRKPRNP